MVAFVRKNVITMNAVFTPPGFQYWNRETNAPNPPPPQPSAAEMVLTYRASNGQQTATIAMTLGSDGVTWSCEWDSSAALEGPVTWVAYASGTVQAANQGQFLIQANQANTF